MYDIYIKNAFEQKDYEECVNSFLDILDYKNNILHEDSYKMVLIANNNLIKDKIFYQIYEKALPQQMKNNYTFLMASLVFNFYNNNNNLNKNIDNLLNYNNKPEGLDAEIHQSEYFKKFNEEISSKKEENNEINNKILELLNKFI